jgi:hypothetical protein
VSDVTVEFRAIVAGQLVSRSVVVPQIAAGQGGELDSTIGFQAGALPAAGQFSADVRGARVD